MVSRRSGDPGHAILTKASSARLLLRSYLQMEEPMPARFSRRSFMATAAAVGGALLVATACQQQAATLTPTQQAEAPTKPAAAVATPVPANAQQSQGSNAGLMRPSDGTPKRGGTMNMAFGVTTAHYDIHQGGSASALTHLYNNLIRFNLVDGLKSIIPDLAESWTVAPDGLSYTFKLRSGVKFHDDTPFSADDVVATFSRIINPPAGIAITSNALFSQVAGIEKVDANTVKFTMKKPQTFFLEILCGTDMIIYPKKALDDNKQDLRKVLAPGTGAFKFQDYKQAEKWTLVKNPNYWDKELPYLDTLVLQHVPNWPDRGTAVLTAQSDITWNASRDTWTDGSKKNVMTNKLPNFAGYFVLYNVKQKPFDDPRVRQAISLAISRQDIIQAFISQEWINLTRWVPHGDEFATPQDTIATLPGYRADKTADRAKAKQLLADAGYPNGIPNVDFLVASVPAHSQIMGPAIQDQLKQHLGIDAKIRVQERSLLVEQEKSGKFAMVLDTPGGSIPDFSPIANLYLRTGASSNWGGYSNPKFDDLLASSDAELDHGKRKALLDQMQDLLDQDPPWLNVGYTFHLPMWQPYVKGLAMDKHVFSQWTRVETAWLDK
jgi:peptide/nickel transport system substrate-binding protein